MNHLSCLLALTSLALVAANGRKPVVLTATELAPAAVRADKPTPGKWWLRRGVAGVPGGALLMTGKPDDRPIPKEKLTEWGVVPADRYTTPYRVPPLEFNPKVKGWHRITVGLYQHSRIDNGYAVPFQPRLWGRLGGDPYAEFLQAPQGSTGPAAEVEWRVADLTGKTLQIEQPPAPMLHPGCGWLGGFSHVTLTPLSEAEVAAGKQETLPPLRSRLFGLLDTTDEIFWYGTAESADDIKAMIWRHEQAGFGRVYLRCWGSTLDTSVAVPEANARWTDADEVAYRKANGSAAGWRPYLDLPKKFDLLQVASAYGAERAIEVHAWVRLTNLNRPPYAEFWHRHPEYQAEILGRDGKTRSRYSRVLSFAHPEVRAFYVTICKQLASTGTKGILLDLLRHPPLCGFEKPAAEAFKKKYGIEMTSVVKPGEDSRGPLIHHPQINQMQADFLELFLRNLRKAVGPEFEIGVRSSGPAKFGLRGKEWIESGLIQTIVDGNWYSGSGPRTTIDATVAAAGTMGHAYAIAEPGNVDPKTWGRKPGALSPEAILALARHYKAKGVEASACMNRRSSCGNRTCGARPRGGLGVRGEEFAVSRMILLNCEGCPCFSAARSPPLNGFEAVESKRNSKAGASRDG